MFSSVLQHLLSLQTAPVFFLTSVHGLSYSTTLPWSRTSTRDASMIVLSLVQATPRIISKMYLLQGNYLHNSNTSMSYLCAMVIVVAVLNCSLMVFWRRVSVCESTAGYWKYQKNIQSCPSICNNVHFFQPGGCDGCTKCCCDGRPRWAVFEAGHVRCGCVGALARE